MDYADLRYYVASYGRFNTADRTASSAMSPNPASWNRYSYALGDQVNSSDPKPFLFLAASDDLRVNHRRQIAGVLMLTNHALSNPSAFIRSMTWNQSRIHIPLLPREFRIRIVRHCQIPLRHLVGRTSDFQMVADRRPPARSSGLTSPFSPLSYAASPAACEQPDYDRHGKKKRWS